MYSPDGSTYSYNAVQPPLTVQMQRMNMSTSDRPSPGGQDYYSQQPGFADRQRMNYIDMNTSGMQSQRQNVASPYGNRMDQSFDRASSPHSRPAMTSSQQDVRGLQPGYYAPPGAARGREGPYIDDRFSDRASSIVNPLDERFSEPESSVIGDGTYDHRYDNAAWRPSQLNGTFVKDTLPSSGASLSNGVVYPNDAVPQSPSVVRPLHSPNNPGSPAPNSIPYRAPSVNVAPSRMSPMFGGSQIIDSKWRNPDLREVIDYLSHENDAIKANAAAYLQHLTYMDDNIKAQTRVLRGIPALVDLVNHPVAEVHRSACGALRNLSYGKANEENKRDIKNAGGIAALARLIRTTNDNDALELASGILWNLSSCQDLKKFMIDDGLQTLVENIVKPAGGFGQNRPGIVVDNYRTTVFRNTSGILRNVSSDGFLARQKLRACDLLVDSIIDVVSNAIRANEIDNKCVENCVCILRNLSYACQEVIDPTYLEKRTPANIAARDDTTGCFGGKKRKPPVKSTTPVTGPASGSSSIPRGDRGVGLLWQPNIIQIYLTLIQDCTNPDTLEAAAGAIQNLAACDWQPAIDVRTTVRQLKGLNMIIDLLKLNSDRVVCAAATALRNLALDPKNKELIGKCAMAQLVSQLPSPNRHADMTLSFSLSNETIAAVEAALYEIIKSNLTHAKSLIDEGGIQRLMHIVHEPRGVYSDKVVRFAQQLLNKMWECTIFHDEYARKGWKKTDFVGAGTGSKSLPASAENTINRPHMGQSGSGHVDTMHIDRQRTQPPPYTYGGSTLVSGQNPNQSFVVDRQYSRDSLQRPVSPHDIPMTNFRHSYASQPGSYYASDPRAGADNHLPGYSSHPEGEPPGYNDVRPYRDDDGRGLRANNPGYVEQDLRAYSDAGRDYDERDYQQQQRNYPPSAHGGYPSEMERYPGDVSFDSQTAAHAGMAAATGRYAGDNGDQFHDPLAVHIRDPLSGRAYDDDPRYDTGAGHYPLDRGHEPVYAHVQPEDRYGDVRIDARGEQRVNDVDSWV